MMGLFQENEIADSKREDRTDIIEKKNLKFNPTGDSCSGVCRRRGPSFHNLQCSTLVKVACMPVFDCVFAVIYVTFRELHWCISRVPDQNGVSLLYINGSQPEWRISSMIYSRNTPFWSETLDIMLEIHHSGREPSIY